MSCQRQRRRFAYLPLFLRRSTSLLETSPASISASMHACDSDRPLRSIQFRKAALSRPYSPQNLRYASAQCFFSAGVIFLGSAAAVHVWLQIKTPVINNPNVAFIFDFPQTSVPPDLTEHNGLSSVMTSCLACVLGS